jgi:Protein of unknown function (DUF664)
MGISVDALTSFVDQAVDELTSIVTSLGDDRVNQRPDLPGANSPYAILYHCLGVMAYWGGHVVAGRDVQRDRAAEFTATGHAADLVAAVHRAKIQFRADARTADPQAPPRRTAGRRGPGALEVRSQGHALLHVLEEVYQHLGQAELTRDILLEQL